MAAGKLAFLLVLPVDFHKLCMKWKIIKNSIGIGIISSTEIRRTHKKIGSKGMTIELRLYRKARYGINDRGLAPPRSEFIRGNHVTVPCIVSRIGVARTHSIDFLAFSDI